MGSFIVPFSLPGFGLGFTLALNAKLILNFPDARTGLGDISDRLFVSRSGTVPP